MPWDIYKASKWIIRMEVWSHLSILSYRLCVSEILSNNSTNKGFITQNKISSHTQSMPDLALNYIIRTLGLFIFLLCSAQCVTASLLTMQAGCSISGYCIGSQEGEKVKCILNDFLRSPIRWLMLLSHWLDLNYLATPCCNESRKVKYLWVFWYCFWSFSFFKYTIKNPSIEKCLTAKVEHPVLYTGNFLSWRELWSDHALEGMLWWLCGRLGDDRMEAGRDHLGDLCSGLHKRSYKSELEKRS